MPYLVDIFCGCGGASLGFALAGFEIVAALDVDRNACKTYEMNLGVKPIRADAFELDPMSLLSETGLTKRELDVLVACPPCQPFSRWAKTNGNPKNDDRRFLVPLVAEFVEAFLPKFLVFENVPRLLKHPWRTYLDSLLKKLTKLGYVYEKKVVNAVDYGIPQNRRRLLLVAADYYTFKRCRVRHLIPPTTVSQRRTVRDAISDLPPLKAGESHPAISNHVAPCLSPEKLELVKMIPKDGGTLLMLPKKYHLPCQLRGGFNNAWSRMRWDEPAPTLTTRCTNPSSGRFLHPEQDRAVTPREAARLQSFPDWFTFPQSVTIAARLIGDATPPLLMMTVAKHLYCVGNTSAREWRFGEKCPSEIVLLLPKSPL
ncbi:MAG: DNA cytosine methyltransferase [Thermoprotei archaeon]|nr:MAG: DNA cytosine methyltransferase [Thermoprotei archaeon]